MKCYTYVMKTLLLYLLLSISLVAQTLTPQNPLRFLALGDSYTIGESVAVDARWPVQLSDSLGMRGIVTDTLNIIATTGWRTDNLINAISNKNLGNQHYNLVSLLIGVNNQYQGRPFLQYQLEFPALLDSAIRYAAGDKSHVFVVSIPDYAYTPYGQSTANPAQISSELDQYNQFAKHIADSLGVSFFNITPISRLGLQNTSYVAGDGLHPSGIQYTEWIKLILQAVDGTTTGIPGANNTNDFTVNIIPGPAQDCITIEIPLLYTQQTTTLSIYDMAGKKMMDKTLSDQRNNISIAELPTGIYLLKLRSGGKDFVKKIEKTGN